MRFSEWFDDFGIFVKSGITAFPWTVFSGFVLSILAIVVIHEADADPYLLFNAVACVALAIPLLFAVEVSRKVSWSYSTTMISKVCILLFLGILYYWLPNGKWPEATIHQVMGLFVVAHLLASFLPFVGNDDNEIFWKYNLNIFQNILTSILLSLVLIIGIALSLKSFDFLFNTELDSKYYGYTAVLILGSFATLFFAWRFNKEELYMGHEDIRNKIRNTCFFVLLPLLGLYIFVLYGYIIKILATWSLPIGWISKLVIFYSILSIFIYLISYNNEGKLKTIRPWLRWLLILPVIFLFVAIYTRLEDYGITHMRYYVVSLAIWLVFFISYAIFTKKVSMKIIPMSLTIFILTALFIPAFNAFSCSKDSQAKRVFTNLSAVDYPNIAETPSEEKKNLLNQVGSSLDYLDKIKGKRELVDIAEKYDLKIDSDKMSSAVLRSRLGIKRYYNTDARNTDARRLPNELHNTRALIYQEPHELDSVTFVVKAGHEKKEYIIGDDILIVGASKPDGLEVSINDESINIELKTIWESLRNRHGYDVLPPTATPKDMMYKFDLDQWSLTILFNQFSYYNDGGNDGYFSIEYIYLKKKAGNN